MLHFFELGNQIGYLDQLWLGVPSGDADVLGQRAVLQKGNDLVDRQNILPQGDVEFIQDDEIIGTSNVSKSGLA